MSAGCGHEDVCAYIEKLERDVERLRAERDQARAARDSYRIHRDQFRSEVERLREEFNEDKDGTLANHAARLRERVMRSEADAALEIKRLRELLAYRNKDSFVTERHHPALTEVERLREDNEFLRAGGRIVVEDSAEVERLREERQRLRDQVAELYHSEEDANRIAEQATERAMEAEAEAERLREENVALRTRPHFFWKDEHVKGLENEIGRLRAVLRDLYQDPAVDLASHGLVVRAALAQEEA